MRCSRQRVRCFVRAFVFASLFVVAPQVHADVIVSAGTAEITLNEGVSLPISVFDAYFDDLASRSQALSDPAPGNAGFIDNGGSVTLIDPIRPHGDIPLSGDGRARQSTTLTIEDVSDVLGSWSLSNDNGLFVGGSTLGEQIALTSLQRWTGPFVGSLTYGDFALRYTGSRLVLTSNIDFVDAAFAEIGNPNIDIAGETLSISGDLLVGEALAAFDQTSLGADFGDINFTATLHQTAAVPEPSSALMLAAGIGSAALMRRRRRASGNESSK
ncbi:PEP-CTERM sorting domain-containing protein [Rosistilla oblonga]|uniref:PEP-CTERM sorting domain-containing protein n=1 Tax=Rosistilla oblonga TaxID=2527990 RepID=UPI0018D207A5|nr:PEP-CTERM sorting domain-containing protein [Rosistilla oblonga]